MSLSKFTHVSTMLTERKREVQIQKYKIILKTKDKVVQGIYRDFLKFETAQFANFADVGQSLRSQR